MQEQLQERLPVLDAEAEALRARHQQARARSEWFGPGRRRLPGPLGAAPHLLGRVAGDAGFDPLALGADPAVFARNYEAELVHMRWAMMAAVGCLVPEVLSLRGTDLGEPVWWKVGRRNAISVEIASLNRRCSGGGCKAERRHHPQLGRHSGGAHDSFSFMKGCSRSKK